MADEGKPDAVIRRVTGVYLRLLGILVALLPLAAIAYVGFFQGNKLHFEAHGLHEVT